MNFIEKKISQIKIQDVVNLNIEEFHNEIKIIEHFLSQNIFWDTYEYIKNKKMITEAELQISNISSYDNIPLERKLLMQKVGSSVSYSGKPSYTVCKRINAMIFSYADLWNESSRLDISGVPMSMSIFSEISDSENYEFNGQQLLWHIPDNTLYRNIHLHDICSLKEYRKLKKDPVFSSNCIKIREIYSDKKHNIFHKMIGEIIVDMFNKNKDIIVNINNNNPLLPFISTNNQEINAMYSKHLEVLQTPLFKPYIFKSLQGLNYENINCHNFGEKLPSSIKLMREHWLSCKHAFDIIQERKSIADSMSSLKVETKQNNRI